MRTRSCGLGLTLAISYLFCLPAGAQTSQQAAVRSFDPAREAALGKRPTPKAPDGHPDLSGIWSSTGGTLPFEFETARAPDGSIRATLKKQSSTRELFVIAQRPYADPPHYKSEFQAKLKAMQSQNLNRLDATFVCGWAGLPRVGPPEQIVQTHSQVVFLNEDLAGMVFRVVPTDGRPYRDIDPTYYGDGVGHWEGDTLVFDTVSVKGWDTDHDSILDRTGLIISSAMHAVSRIRKINDTTLEAQVTIDDSKALTKPWVVTKQFRRQPKGTRVYDYGCAENNRNPVQNGHAVTLGSDGKTLQK